MKKIILILVLMFITSSCSSLERSEQFRFQSVYEISTQTQESKVLFVSSVPGYFVNLLLFPVWLIDKFVSLRFDLVNNGNWAGLVASLVLIPEIFEVSHIMFGVIGISTYKFVSEL